MKHRQNLPFVVEKWSQEYDASGFTSTLTSITKYIKNQAHRDVSSFTSAVFVLVEPKQKAIFGYYSLSSVGVVFDELPDRIKKRLPRYPETSAILLGRLGVDTNFSNQKLHEFGKKPRIGESLLFDAQIRVLAQSQNVGSALMVVDAEMPSSRELEAGAKDPLPFYTQYGFVQLAVNPRRLIKTVRQINQEFGLA